MIFCRCLIIGRSATHLNIFVRFRFYGREEKKLWKMFFQSSDWLSGYWMSVVIVCPPQMVDNNRLASSSQNGTYNTCWYFAVAYDKTVTPLEAAK